MVEDVLAVVVSVDIIGQFVASGRGNAFVAVIIDMFTKYTVVVPLRDTTVSDLTSALQTAVFMQSPPRKFISDQSEEFVQEEENRILTCRIQKEREAMVQMQVKLQEAQWKGFCHDTPITPIC